MGIISSSVARKFAMALSGLFLVLFLAQHFTINVTSTFSPETFNEWSHFMGTNVLVQFILQPLLIFGVVFHFVMGFILDYQNRRARGIKYINYKGNNNSSWVSRHMLLSGGVILAFLALHFYDFWVPELIYKYAENHDPDSVRYYDDLLRKFQSPVRTYLYCLAFVLLAMHLWHGFSSTFQSIGWRNKFSAGLRRFTLIYAVAIPAGFIFIALYLHFKQ